MPRKRGKKPFEFDVALSFAGEDRKHAEALAKILHKRDVKVFYDEFLKATLWGKDLFQHLETIYKDKAQYCVVFVSKDYVRKNWTKHELRHAQARSFTADREYILPLRLDDTVLPGLAATVGYLDIRSTKPPQIAALLLEKLGRSDYYVVWDAERANWDGDFVDFNGKKVASFWPKMMEVSQNRPVALVTRAYDRVRYGDETWWKKGQRGKRPTVVCRDCAALPGQYHFPVCDTEQCPACGGQKISCDCQTRSLTKEDYSDWLNTDYEDTKA